MGPVQIMVTVPKKKRRHAVDRVLMRRRIREAYRPVKPDPSIDFAVLLEHPTPKQETMHVGDSAVDIETARRACIDSVGVTWGFRPSSELRKAHADHIVSSPAEILRIALKEY